MTMVTTMAGERINYLSVALRARDAIKTLKSLAKQDRSASTPSKELKHELELVVNSLKAVDPSHPLHSKLSHEGPYTRFEEVQTLDEVTKSFKDTQVLSGLEALLEGGCKEEDVRTAVRLFSAIERRALYHYNDPFWAEKGM
jgi:hypothetical protein